MATFDGRVALVTGAARGQGRSHAVQLASQGASLVVCDIAGGEFEKLPYETSTGEDLAETVALIEAEGGDVVAVTADLREVSQVQNVVDVALERFSQIDIAVLNHGICTYAPVGDITDNLWREMIDTDLHSYFYLSRAIVPHMAERNYGRIVMTASAVSRGGTPNIAHYVAAKWGLVGFMKSLSQEVARDGITVNCVLPGMVATPMIFHDDLYRLFCPHLSEPTVEDFKQVVLDFVNPMPVPWVEPEDISAVVTFLVSDEARYISGSAHEVSCGYAVNTTS